MNYANILDIFLEKFPVFGDSLGLEYATQGWYVVFSLYITPQIIKYLVNNLDYDKLLVELFAFFNEMAVCDVAEVRNLLVCTILEQLSTDPGILLKAEKYMGEETLRIKGSMEDSSSRTRDVAFILSLLRKK